MDLLPVELSIYYCALQYLEPFLDVNTKMCLLPGIFSKIEMDFLLCDKTTWLYFYLIWQVMTL